MKRIESRSDFVKDYGSLLQNLDDSIQNLSQYANQQNSNLRKEVIEKINRLKWHHKKLKDKLDRFAGASEEQWQQIKSAIKEDYQKAKTELQTVRVQLKAN